MLICFDICDGDTFDALDFWLTDIEKHAPKNILVLVCGMKADLAEDREVDREDAEHFCQQKGLEYFEVSSKTGANVNEVFYRIASQVNQAERAERERQRAADEALVAH